MKYKDYNMFILATIETVDITKELPLAFWLGFAAFTAVILPLANRILTNMFIPKKGRDEAPIWSKYDKKTPKY